MTQFPPRRNPIVRRGKVGKKFVQIPNELARDESLSHYAYRIAIVLRTHHSGWQVSANSLVKTYGCSRGTVAKALAELVKAGWLGIRRFENERGNRVFDEYHIDMAGRFSPEEMAEFDDPVVVGVNGGPSEITQVQSDGTPGCSSVRQSGDSTGDTKEHQPKHHSKHHLSEHFGVRPDHLSKNFDLGTGSNGNRANAGDVGELNGPENGWGESYFASVPISQMVSAMRASDECPW